MRWQQGQPKDQPLVYLSNARWTRQPGATSQLSGTKPARAQTTRSVQLYLSGVALQLINRYKNAVLYVDQPLGPV